MTAKRSYAVRLAAAALFGAAAVLLHIAARKMPGFADGYAEKVSPVLIGTIGRIFNLLPFSGVEFGIYAILFALIAWLVRLVIRAVRREEGTLSAFVSGLSRLLLLASVIFLLYEAGEDVCFYRTPFSSRYDLGSGAYDTEDLCELCEALADACSRLSDKVKRNADGIMIVDANAAKRAVRNMQSLGESYDILKGFYCRPKPVLMSFLMSYTNMAGIFSAYTYEANYNREMTPYNIPFTMSHELSHEKGVMQEQEANLAAFLNCIYAEDPDFCYSGALSGWVYCGNELYKRDYESWSRVNSRLDKKVLLDLDANTEFWESRRSKVSEKARSLNDSYLKGHGQKEGAASYDRVVDLIISWWKKSGDINPLTAD